MILMEHPDHGMMHVYSDGDAYANEKNGWKRVPPTPLPEETKDESQAQPVEPAVIRKNTRLSLPGKADKEL